jgi:hypothetical protein
VVVDSRLLPCGLKCLLTLLCTVSVFEDVNLWGNVRDAVGVFEYDLLQFGNVDGWPNA